MDKLDYMTKMLIYGIILGVGAAICYEFDRRALHTALVIPACLLGIVGLVGSIVCVTEAK